MEERLTAGAGGDADKASLGKEIVELRVQVDAGKRELEDRDLLLFKARNALESLQAKLDAVQGVPCLYLRARFTRVIAS